MNPTYTDERPADDELNALYGRVGWTAYTRDPAGLARALRRFAPVRTLALMTDDEPRQHAFYRSLGLAALPEVAGGRLHVFLRS